MERCACRGSCFMLMVVLLVTNVPVDKETAEEINKLFFEIIIAPSYEKNALDILKLKKNRIILQFKFSSLPKHQFRTILNGVLEQEKDLKTEVSEDMQVVTTVAPNDHQKNDLDICQYISEAYEIECYCAGKEQSVDWKRYRADITG